MVWGSSAGSMVCGVSVISVLLLEWCVWLACPPAGSAVQPAAVDRQDRPGYVGGFVGQDKMFSTGVIVSSSSFLGTTLRPPSAGESRGSYGFPASQEGPGLSPGGRGHTGAH